MEFKGKNVLLSGGSSGIGLALAKEFIQAGANVSLLARREELLVKAKNELEGLKVDADQQIHTFSADVGNMDSLKQALQDDASGFDVLVNCAGIAYPGEFTELKPEIFEEVMRINFLGTVYLTKLVVPGMVERRAGYVVNISSLAALIGIYGYTAYAPSKYAVRGFSRCLRSELKAYGIDVSVVLPPDTDTPQLAFEHSIIPDITRKINENGGVMSPEKVAEIVMRGMRRRKFTIVPGLEGKLLYGLSSIIGRYFYWMAVGEHRKKLRNSQ
ncbi:MAG: 3-dehydrosphinganine reductase [Chloroflexota bacterium]|nr:3-dehydrosphinganine reductase [Chloroflexota bacterium]